jgi:hypothetical protein
MDGWMHGCMDGWMHGWMDGWMDGCMDGCMHGWMHGWMDGWMDGWMHGCMDGCMDGYMDRWMKRKKVTGRKNSKHWEMTNEFKIYIRKSKETEDLCVLVVGERIILKQILGKSSEKMSTESHDSGYDQLESFLEHGSEISVSIKGGLIIFNFSR